MNILHTTPYYKPAYVYGGPIHSGSALCEALVKKGHHVTVLTTTANGDDELSTLNEIVQGVNVLRFKRYTKNNTFLAPGMIWYLLKNIKKYEVVHIHTWWNLVSIFALVVCTLYGKRPVLSPRGMLCDYIINTNNPRQKKIIQKLFGKSMLSKVKFHATASSEVTEIQMLYPKATVANIFNFVNIPAIVKPLTPANETVNLIFLSRIDPKKGIEILLDALATISWKYHLNVFGPCKDDYLKELKDRANANGITDKVTWHGTVFGDKKFEMLADNDLLVLPSYNENFANVVIETLAMGTPVLVSNMVGLASYIKDNKVGWICETNSKSIADTLSAFKEDTASRDYIRNEAPNLIKQDFDHDLLVNQYLEYYTASC